MGPARCHRGCSGLGTCKRRRAVEVAAAAAAAVQVYIGNTRRSLQPSSPLNRPVPVPRGTASNLSPPTMPPGSTRAPTWAALPQELVQQAASVLGDDDRWVGAAAGGLQALRGEGGGAAKVAAGGRWRAAVPPPRPLQLHGLPPPQGLLRFSTVAEATACRVRLPACPTSHPPAGWW